MQTLKLSSKERRVLRKEQHPAFLLGFGILLLMTALNFAFHYKDVIMGMDVIERPPISQLIVIQIVALIIGPSIYYFMARNVLKDLKSGIKNIEKTVVLKKFFKRIDGKLEYFLRLTNGLEMNVDKASYQTFDENESILAHYSPNTKRVFSIHHENC